MNSPCKPAVPLKELRIRAEKRLAKTPREGAQMPVADRQKLVHELQVHQIELEMQNAQMRETQLQLESALDRYAELYNFAPVAYLSLSPQGEILEANLRAGELLGLQRGVLMHQQFTRFVQAEAQDAYCLLFRQVFSSGARQSAELELVTAQAKRLVVLVEAVSDPSRPLTQARFSLTDITERKRAEDDLRTSERSLRILTRALEQSPASVVITNTAGEIEYVNPKFTEISGYSLADVLGKNPRLLKSGHHSPEFYQELWTTITSGRDWRGELCNQKKDGSLFWEAAVIAPIHDEHGTVTHFVALKEDITDRRRLEAELLDVADREQQRIGHDLHDGLGQRLTALEMRCFVLKEELAADQPAARRRERQKQVQQISRALRECITVTRSIAHGLAPVVLKNEGLMGALEKLAQHTRVPRKLECRFVCLSPMALDDFQTAMQFYRIAQEAVNNALKHARARRIHIQLTHANGLLRLQIKDDGRGLPKHRKFKSGIGLEVMRHRAHAIGATLEIVSQPGKGVSITCTLPIGSHEN